MVQKNSILVFTRERLESKLRNYNTAVQIPFTPATLALGAAPIFSIENRMK